MAKRDYSSGRSTRKSVSSKTNRLKQPNLPTYLLFFVAGVLLTLFGVLYWLKRSNSTPTLPTRHLSTLKKKLPSKPQERWHYIEALENKEVLIPLAPSSSVLLKDSSLPPTHRLSSFKAPQWWIYCEPLQPSESLQSLRAHLALLGFEGTMIREGKRQQLALGPYAHRQIAGRRLQQLQGLSVACCAISGG